MRIHLGGNLIFYLGQRQAWFNYDISQTTSVTDIVARLGIPPAEIAFIVVNGAVVDLENTILTNLDTLQIYPPNDGG